MALTMIEDLEPSNRPPASLSLVLQGLPLAASLASGAPWFSLIYLPLAVIGNTAEADPAATLVAATLFYGACASLGDPSVSELLLTAGINLGCAGVLLAIGAGEVETETRDGIALSEEDVVLKDWDRRFQSRDLKR